MFHFSVRSKSTIECNCNKDSKTDSISFIGSLLSLSATIFTFFDRLTPIFEGAFDFRLRILASIFLLGLALYFAVRMIRLKHTAHGSVVGSMVQHFSYDKKHRMAAKLILLPLFFGFIFSVYHVKYWFGTSTTIEGFVYAPSGKPLQDVRLEILNLDKEPIYKDTPAAFSDSEGRFVIEIKNNGRVAFLRFTLKGCTYTEKITDSQFERLIGRESNNETQLEKFYPSFLCNDQ